MSNTTFTDLSTTNPGTPVVASWLNDINSLAYNVCGTGTVVPTTGAALLTNVGGAALASPTFTGVPLAPTAAVGTASTQLATTAFASAVPSPMQTLTASVGSNALTVNWTGAQISMRSATASSGTVTVFSPGSLSITVPASATLGTSNGVAAKLAVILLNSGGTGILGICNAKSSSQLDEGALSTPTTISSGATSASVIYSATACAASSPFRVVGFIDITEATAGTWVTAPSGIQGCGGLANIGFAIANSGFLANSSAFTNSQGSAGYQKLPTGLIIQWGNNTTAGAGGTAVTFPITFPTNVYQVFGGSNSTGTYPTASSLTTSGFSWITNGSNTAHGWIAIGN